MKIAVDYDNTYSRDPRAWDEALTVLINAGHEVRIVTFRNDELDKDTDLLLLEDAGVIVHYTRGSAKRWWLDQFTSPHWLPDVVIDDKPESWLDNSTLPREGLEEWRSKGRPFKHGPVSYVRGRVTYLDLMESPSGGGRL
jgi:hypothetical protein